VNFAMGFGGQNFTLTPKLDSGLTFPLVQSSKVTCVRNVVGSGIERRFSRVCPPYGTLLADKEWIGTFGFFSGLKLIITQDILGG